MNMSAENRLSRGAAERQGIRVQHDEGGLRTIVVPYCVIHNTLRSCVSNGCNSVTRDTAGAGDLCHSAAPLELCTYSVAANGRGMGEVGCGALWAMVP